MFHCYLSGNKLSIYSVSPQLSYCWISLYLKVLWKSLAVSVMTIKIFLKFFLFSQWYFQFADVIFSSPSLCLLFKYVWHVYLCCLIGHFLSSSITICHLLMFMYYRCCITIFWDKESARILFNLPLGAEPEEVYEERVGWFHTWINPASYFRMGIIPRILKLDDRECWPNTTPSKWEFRWNHGKWIRFHRWNCCRE